MAQRVGRGIALLFHDRGTRSSTPRPYFTPRKDTVLIGQEAGWAPGLVWKGGKSPDRSAHSSVAIMTELPGPQKNYIFDININRGEPSSSFAVCASCVHIILVSQ